jgi:hypothetical protein
MQNEIAATDGAPALSQGERVVDTFIAPSKTFTDILRSANCWLPLVIIVLITVVWGFSIDKKVGFAAAAETQISKSPKQEDALQQLPPDQRAQRMAMTVKITRITTYASFMFVFLFMAFEALLLWGAFNFGLGASTSYGQVFAVIAFAGLPRSLIWILSTILIWAGVGTENFDMRNPAGTNLGYYLQDSPKWMSTAGQFFDVFGFWSMALLILGMAIISRKKITQSATIVIGLWLLGLLITTGVSAATS